MFSSSVNFVEKLIKEHRKKTQKADLEAMLLVAIEQFDRGEGQDLPPDYFDRLHRSGGTSVDFLGQSNTGMSRR